MKFKVLTKDMHFLFFLIVWNSLLLKCIELYVWEIQSIVIQKYDNFHFTIYTMTLFTKFIIKF